MKIIKFNFLSSISDQIVFYPTPAHINYFWNFGSLAGVFLSLQIITGFFLSMHYTANVDNAFYSVEHIMRDVNFGWVMRYLHSNGASFFFVFLYLHIGRALYYKSYIGNFYTWFLGIVIFLLAMATAFLGYVLPWGQMSFWGATVITNLFSALPYVGKTVSYLLWGGFSVGNPTLNRFFSLHYLIPFIIAAAALIHVVVLHEVGSSAPVGWKYADKIYFYPYFYVKDLFGFFIFFLFYTGVVFYEPNLLGHPDNYIEANPLVTPPHIVPEWYFLPFYAILRSIPNKLAGVIFMFLSIIIFFFLNTLEDLFSLPRLNNSNFKSNNDIDGEQASQLKSKYSLSSNIWLNKFYEDMLSNSITINAFIDPKFLFLNKVKYWIFVINFFLLGCVGAMPAEEPFVTLGLYLTIFYFFYILLLSSIINYYEVKSVEIYIKNLKKLL